MSFGNLIRHRRPFFYDGRRYVVRGPTYATIYTLMEQYGVEVYAIARQYMEKPESVTAEALLRLVPEHGTDDRRMVAVLSTCVDTDVDPALWPLRGLVRASIGMADLEAILRYLDIQGLGEAAEGGANGEYDGPSPESVGIVQLATLFHVPPHEVADWPFEAVMQTWECLEALEIVKPSTKDDEYVKLVKEAAKRHERVKA